MFLFQRNSRLTTNSQGVSLITSDDDRNGDRSIDDAVDANNDESMMTIKLKGEEDMPTTANAINSSDVELENINQQHKINIDSNESNYFSDGIRRIDYVLVYEEAEGSSVDNENDGACSMSNIEEMSSAIRRKMKRDIFEENLRMLGLELEPKPSLYSGSRTRFILLHAPYDVLVRQAEIMQIKMPIVKSTHSDDNSASAIIKGCIDSVLNRIDAFQFGNKIAKRLHEPEYYMAPFSVERQQLFIGSTNHEHFFPNAERSRMVYDLLIRTLYDRAPIGNNVDSSTTVKNSESSSAAAAKYRIGIERLINNGTYTAAFPLHEGSYKISKIDFDSCTDRQLLYDTWAKPTRFYKYQPLTLIKKYFGSKIGIYFAWLGYYTKVLFPAAIVGMLCVFFGMGTLNSDVPSTDICGYRGGIGNDILMCPNCDSECKLWRLNESCDYSRVTHVFDNYATVIFAAFMSIWATLFLEGWKRYHSEIAWTWGLLDSEIEEESIRPEFQFSVQTKRKSPVTGELEPFLPKCEQIKRWLGSGVTVVFFLLLVLAFVVGIVIYRVIVVNLLYNNTETTAYASILTSITAAILNLIVILIMNYVYNYLAWQLTNWECPRTQTAFDNSYAFKVFLFQFINYYSSLFYIAFIKGKFSVFPGDAIEDREQGHYRIFGHRLETCDPAGCMVELVIQLSIIMVGKQAFSGFMEIGYPIIMNCFRKWRFSSFVTDSSNREDIEKGKKKKTNKRRISIVNRKGLSKIDRITNDDNDAAPQWEQDYALNPTYDQFLFDEYLEMILQFGFVTLFVAAFPLAPLFALINNILEIRLDAYKFVVATRRPMPARARDIGIWLPILDGVSKIAVLTNACVIAFTSDFVPKMIYLVTHETGTLVGYINDSLSYYYINSSSRHANNSFNATECRFRDYRKPPCILNISSSTNHMNDCDDRYGFSLQWWHVLAARLAFVLVFEHLVFMIKGTVAYLIPDVPTHIFMKLQRDRYLARKARLEYMLTETQSSVIDGDTTTTNTDSFKANGLRRRTLVKHQSIDNARVANQPGSPNELDERHQSFSVAGDTVSDSSFHSVDDRQRQESSSSGRASPLVIDEH